FGLADTPKIGPRKEPVRLALLAPNGRPVQTTRDLRSFWNTTYAEVRKELRGRYPKHPWPEDPWTATPTARTRRKAWWGVSLSSAGNFPEERPAGGGGEVPKRGGRCAQPHHPGAGGGIDFRGVGRQAPLQKDKVRQKSPHQRKHPELHEHRR